MITEFCELLAGDNAKLYSELTNCALDPITYYENHEDDFLERGIDEYEIEEEGEEGIRLIGIVDILLGNEWAVELDWKCSLEDFVYFLEGMTIVKRNDLPVNAEEFEEDKNVAAWCKVLDEKWKDEDMCMAGIDIESDSYVIFPYSAHNMSKLVDCGRKCNIRVDYAKNL